MSVAGLFARHPLTLIARVPGGKTLEDAKTNGPRMGYAGAGEMADEGLILRLNSQAAQRMTLRSRLRNLKSMLNSQRCVVHIDDGLRTRELIFDQPPTVRQLAGHVGRDDWIVSVKMRRVRTFARKPQMKVVL